MTYALPAGDALAVSFDGSVKTPPTGNHLGLSFREGVDVIVAFPVPPNVMKSVGTRWGEGSAHTFSAGARWSKSVSHTIDSHLVFGEADIQTSVDHRSGWDSVPVKDDTLSPSWGTPTSENTEAESHWANTRPTDPDAIKAPWHKASLLGDGDTRAPWAQPASKDQASAQPWFRVDTIKPPWNINDHRHPPLWYDPPNALSFQFDGHVYHPNKVPELWFRFDGRIAPRPIQPKDASPAIRWQQAAQVDIAPALLWGEGRYERIKDTSQTIDYGGKVQPLPLEPPLPDDMESYLLMNTVNAVRLPDEEPLELLDISIELDMDSFTWQLSASVASKAVLALIEPDQNGTKDIRITINGWNWVFMVDRYDTERSFNSERFTIRGESRTKLLTAPYAPLRSKTETNAISALQAATAELTNTGFTLTWDSTESWATPDWILPGGVFSYGNQTPMQVIAQIANTAGAVLIPAADTDNLALQPRYRISPWNWLEDTTPIDHAVPESMVLSMSVEWSPEPEHNAVYVSGTYEGVAVAVQRTGSAGDKPAPDIIEDWLTATDVNAERGRNLLCEGGQQAVVTLDLPLTVKGQEPGLVLPGKLVQVMERSETWIGLCLSTGIRTAGSGAGKVVQSLSLERHY